MSMIQRQCDCCHESFEPDYEVQSVCSRCGGHDAPCFKLTKFEPLPSLSMPTLLFIADLMDAVAEDGLGSGPQTHQWWKAFGKSWKDLLEAIRVARDFAAKEITGGLQPSEDKNG